MSEERSIEDEFLDALDGHKCEDCGKYGDDVTFGENPFASEIHDDHTEYWMCEECRYQSAMDI